MIPFTLHLQQATEKPYCRQPYTLYVIAARSHGSLDVLMLKRAGWSRSTAEAVLNALSSTEWVISLSAVQGFSSLDDNVKKT
eukprot:6537801-Prymnesium_polylepis.1